MTLEIGTLVTHSRKPEWGLGKVLRRTGDQALVFFADAGAHNGATKNPLELLISFLAPSRVTSHPRLDHLAPLGRDSVTSGEEYVSLEQGVALFLDRFPRGFADPAYREEERDYKWAAHKECVRLLGRGPSSKLLNEGAHDEIVERALRVVGMVNLPTRWDHMALNDGLKAPVHREAFAVALVALLHGDRPYSDRFTEFAQILGSLPVRQSPIATWANQTILPYLFDPTRHMFLKPDVTKQAASRCAFDLRYKSEPNWTTYAQLLKLCEVLLAELKRLKPLDYIDIQSFIWKIGDR